MIKTVFAACALLCVLTIAAVADSPHDFLARVRSIDIVMTRDPPAETCIASQYGIGDGYHGKRAADGSIFNTHALTAAHKTRKFGSRVTVTNLSNGRSVVVRITDRGPFIKGRCIDLSRAGANAIGMGGLARVSVEPER